MTPAKPKKSTLRIVRRERDEVQQAEADAAAAQAKAESETWQAGVKKVKAARRREGHAAGNPASGGLPGLGKDRR